MSIMKNNLVEVSWAHSIENIFKYFDIYHQTIYFFEKSYPGYIYHLDYEKLVTNPEQESKKIMEFCNLTWNKKCLEFGVVVKRKSRDVQRERAGRGSSVGGAPAAAALKSLVRQFSERSSFVRELIQNSLDAGSGRIEVVVESVGEQLRIALYCSLP